MRPQPNVVVDPRTGLYRVRFTVPADLKTKVGKSYLIEPLGTRELRVANERAVPVLNRFKAYLDGLRQGQAASALPTTVPTRKIFTAIERWDADERREYVESQADMDEVRHALRRRRLRSTITELTNPNTPAPNPARNETRVGKVVEIDIGEETALESELRRIGLINPEHPAFRLISETISKLLLKRSYERLNASPPSNSDQAVVPFGTIIDEWARERKPTPKSEYDMRKTYIPGLIASLSYDDAARVTDVELVTYKRRLIAKGYKAKTIYNHFHAMKRMFSFAASNKMISTNPARDVKYEPSEDQKGEGWRGPTDQEAKLILLAARDEVKAHLRWAPWVACFTGARIDELAGAMASHVDEMDGIPCLHITKKGREAGGRLKNKSSFRTVPLHPALIAEGFLKYVEALAPDGPLFPSLKPSKFGRRGHNGSKRVGYWIREKLKLTDPTLAPNHGWRHRFADVLERRMRVPREIRFALDGHALGHIGDDYGKEGYPMTVLYEEISKMPSPVD